MSSLLIEYYGWNIADPICSLFIAVTIFVSVIPLLSQSMKVRRVHDYLHIWLNECLAKALAEYTISRAASNLFRSLYLVIFSSCLACKEITLRRVKIEFAITTRTYFGISGFTIKPSHSQ